MRLDAARGPSCRPAGCERPVSVPQARHSLALPPRRIVPGAMDRTASRRVDAEPLSTETAPGAECPLPAACHGRTFCRSAGHRVRAVDRDVRTSGCRRPPCLGGGHPLRRAAHRHGQPSRFPGRNPCEIRYRGGPTPEGLCPRHSTAIPPKRSTCCAPCGRRTAIRPSRRRTSFATGRRRGLPRLAARTDERLDEFERKALLSR